MSRITTKAGVASNPGGPGWRVLGRFDPIQRALANVRRFSSRPRVREQQRVRRARAHPPSLGSLYKKRSDAQRPGFQLAPKCAPPKRGVAYFRPLGFTGGTSPRPVTASARSHRIPSHSDLNVTPRPTPRFASRRSPGLPGGELRKGPESLSKAMGPTWRSWTPRGEWLPPRRNTAQVAIRKKVTGSDNPRCAIARVSAQDQLSASATNEGDGLHGDKKCSHR